MKTKINEGDGHGRDTDFFTSLQNLAKEIKSRGKRGESIKLKKTLEEETREIAAKGEISRNPKATHKATNELQTRSSPRKTTSTETSAKNASALFDFATSSATSSIVSSSLNLLNAEIADDLESTNVAYNDTEERLDSTQQGTILGFLNMLSDKLHKITYGQLPSSTNDPCSSNITSLSAAPILHVSAASSTDENERKVPLNMDADALFKDILVNPSKLRTAESAALMAKNPSAFLLNKILDTVFHPDELNFSKGVKGLNIHKMEAMNG
uniref:Uncharacterized protein n=1 Tax=Magallana gigas TaxID=29159 RepID=A0A8W8MS20_MAGGI